MDLSVQWMIKAAAVVSMIELVVTIAIIDRHQWTIATKTSILDVAAALYPPMYL